MFSSADVHVGLRDFPGKSPVPISVRQFERKDFEHSAIDQVIEVHRGPRAEYPNGVAFWIKSLRQQKWISEEKFFEYAQRSLCAELTEPEFLALVKEFTCALAEPFRLKPEGAFLGALRMHARKYDLALFGEYEGEYIAFYWHT